MIKGVAILGVIIAHMSFTARFSSDAVQIIEKFQLMFGWCVVAFFFCSGYLSNFEKSNMGELYNYILKMAKRLLLPCIVFSVSFRVLLICIDNYYSLSTPVQFPVSLLSFLEFVFTPLGPQLYFLLYLFFLSVFVYLLSSMIKNKLIVIGIFLLLSIILCNVLVRPDRGYGPETGLIPLYIIAFVFGMNISMNSQYKLIALTTISLLIVCMAIIQNEYLYLYVLVPVALFFLFNKVKNIYCAGLIEKCGRKSATIYVWHAPIILPACSIIAEKLTGSGYFTLLLTFSFTLLLCFVIHSIIFKYECFRLWRL